MDVCEVCGLDRDAIGADEVIPRVQAGVDGFLDVLSSDSPSLAQRPTPDSWSVLEYSGHIRDVLLNQREGIVVALIEHEPVKQKMYRDERVNLGMYAPETAAEISQGIEVAGRLFVNTYRVLTSEQLSRTVIYVGEPRTLAWVGAQAVHEVEHHLADVRRSA